MIIKLAIQNVCDFCAMPSVSWQYPARSFDAMPGVFGSLGEWGACETCHDLIERQNWTALAKRSAERICKDNTKRDKCFAFMLKLHAEFARHRTEDPFRIDH
jgi:hypothetical protein